MIIKTKEVSCPIFRRFVARSLDMLLPILLTTLVALIYLAIKHPNTQLNIITLTRDEMILVTLVNIFCFVLFFLILPSFNKGRTIFKICFGIKIKIERKNLFISILLREFFITTLPSLIVFLFPFTFTELEFSNFFIGNFVSNWGSSISSLGYRVSFFVLVALYFFSLITVFVTKKRKTIYDFIGSTWVYIEKKEIQTIERVNTTNKKRRAGEF